jgi:hypothetical protein
MAFYKILPGWYHIPGFNGYQINYETRQVRSFKNHKADPFHIMAEDKYGNVSITADSMKRTSISPNKLFSITFEQGNKLMPAGESIYLGSRGKLNRSQQVDLNMGGQAASTAQKPKTDYVTGMDFSKFIKD